MKYRRLLFKTSDPFDTFNTEKLFVKAVKENWQYHYDNCMEYKKYWIVRILSLILLLREILTVCRYLVLQKG